MTHNVLITGASGYLGGDLLASISTSSPLPYGKLYALVRTEEQGEAVRAYGAEPLFLDVKDKDAVRREVLEKKLSVVFFLIDAMTAATQVNFIEALGELKKQTTLPVHFLHTSGAKIFSSHASAPTDRVLYDDEVDLYRIQKAQSPANKMFIESIAANNTVIELSEALDVRSYVFAPCIVYGKSRGFGNPISIQTVAVVKAARALKGVARVDEGRPTWPVCHVEDNTSLYEHLLRGILTGQDYDFGKNGYYLAASGSVAWDDIYAGVAKALLGHGLVEDASVRTASQEDLEKMGAALACPPSFVGVMLGGKCTFTARHGQNIGWKAKYQPEHILETVDKEVDLILKNLKWRL